MYLPSITSLVSSGTPAVVLQHELASSVEARNTFASVGFELLGARFRFFLSFRYKYAPLQLKC